MAVIEILAGTPTHRSLMHKSKSELAHAILDLQRATAERQAELIKALRLRSLIRHQRRTYGGGAVDSGGSCSLCKASWDLFDINGERLAEPPSEHHEPNCLLEGTAP